MLNPLDLEFLDSLPDEEKESWLFERSACDASLYYFVVQMGAFAAKAGGDASYLIHKPVLDFWQDNTIKRKMVYMPRAWLKSTILTGWGNFWHYLQNPDIRILIPSQRADLSSKFVRFIKRQAVANRRLRYLYPILQKIDKTWTFYNSWGAIECEFPKFSDHTDPTFKAVGITGGAQGGHYERISPDDLISEKGMESPLVMEDARRWFDNIEELLDDPSDDIVAGTGTHWGNGDLGHYIQEEYPDYKWIIVPALKDESLKDTDNIRYVQNPTVGPNESNWPEKIDTKFYIDMQATPGKEMVFWAQHMNNPSKSGLMSTFDIKWLKYYRWEDRDGKRMIICKDDKEEFLLSAIPQYGFIDPGGFSDKRATMRGSRTAILIGGQPSGSRKKFVTYTWAGRFKEPTKFMDEIFKANKEIKPRLWRQEIFGQQTYILKDIKEEAGKRNVALRIVPLESDERKDAKALNIDALKQVMFNGDIYVHDSMRELMGEISHYPNSLTKDLLDCLSQINRTSWSRGRRGDTESLNARNNDPIPEAREPISRVGY